MKLPLTLLLTAALLAGGVSCTRNRHLISDRKERAQLIEDFRSRRDGLPEGGLFRIFEDRKGDAPPSPLEREALQFLYAYMPLADIADHDGAFFLKNIRASFKAREEMPWGAGIPEREFRHFVLPIRVNNEDLDESRPVFYETLKDRVKDLSLREAVLEINHWCHEKVSYTPSDARTCSPLACIRAARGRCGEESTLTVAALRALCIPARQVYTPRWAHTDDNHAWVEAWIDGKWCFLGACEPEPVLNLAWFNAPVSRGMLMHTKAFGRYEGPEEKMRDVRLFTEINVTENYAPVARAEVRVVDRTGRPVPGAEVEFKIYNYAEFHTVSRKETDAEGRTWLSAGKGDMLVWASKGGDFGFSRISFGKDKTVTLALDRKAGDRFEAELDLFPPPEKADMPDVTPAQRQENDRRLAEEDSVRNAFIAGFPDEARIDGFAAANGLDAAPVRELIAASRGNHAEIMRFMEGLDSPELREGGLDLLRRISRKDLCDTKAEVLRDHLLHHVVCRDEIEREYLRNPRIGTELLTPYHSLLLHAIRANGFDGRKPDDPEREMAAFREDPRKLARWVRDHIRIDSLCNIGGAPMSPMAVWKCRTADPGSRDIFFTALARTLGIPARIDEVTGKVQIFIGKGPDRQIVDIDFGLAGRHLTSDGQQPAPVGQCLTPDGQQPASDGQCLTPVGQCPAPVGQHLTHDGQHLASAGQHPAPVGQHLTSAGQQPAPVGQHLTSAGRLLAPAGRLRLDYRSVSLTEGPKYYTHFTISRFTPSGSTRLLNYEEGEVDMGGGTTWSKVFKDGTAMDAGDYLMVSGTRLANGGVLARLSTFGIREGEETTADLKLRASRTEIQVIGSFNSESGYEDAESGGKKSILQACGRGYFTVGLLGMGQEPTIHALQDIAARKAGLEAWGRPLVLLFPDRKSWEAFRTSAFPEKMPAAAVYGIDDGSIRRQIAREMRYGHPEILPIFFIGDTFNRVVFSSQGYAIGLGDRLLETAGKL